jgi:hypothetical protein
MERLVNRLTGKTVNVDKDRVDRLVGTGYFSKEDEKKPAAKKSAASKKETKE